MFVFMSDLCALRIRQVFRVRNRNLNRVLLFKQLVPDFRRCKACSFKHFSVQVFVVMYDRQFAWSIGKCNSLLSNKIYRSLWSRHAQLSSWDEEVSGKIYISTRTVATDWWKRRCHSDKNKRHNTAVTHWNRIMQIRSEYFTLCFLRPDIAVLPDERGTLSSRWKFVIALQNGKHE